MVDISADCLKKIQVECGVCKKKADRLSFELGHKQVKVRAFCHGVSDVVEVSRDRLFSDEKVSLKADFASKTEAKKK